MNLAKVASSDTRLVAVLVLLARLARSTRVVFEVRASPRLREWINICNLDTLLRSYLAPEPSGSADVRLDVRGGHASTREEVS